MKELLELKLRTNCESCVNKCCSQPHDHVYLSSRERSRLARISGLNEEEFTAARLDADTGYVFRTLNRPCRFLDADTGRCMIYESRPLACRLFPFYVDPLTGDVTLSPSECGENLIFPQVGEGGWRLIDLKEEARQWVGELWDEVVVKECS